jgi:hypothetical protein
MTAESTPRARRPHRQRGWAPGPPRANSGPRAERLAEFAHLRSARIGIADASARVGVGRRTGDRYEAALIASGSAPWKPVLRPVPETPAVAAAGPRKGCGTYLALLLHLDLGETPCLPCLFAGIRRTVGDELSGRARSARKAAA